PKIMNKFRITALLYSAVVFFLISCGSNEQKDNTSNTSDSTTTSTDNPSTASTVVTTPQNMIVVTHKVANFAKWKASYDAHDSTRLAYGVHNYVIGRGIEDSNMVLVAIKVDDINKAKEF